MNVPRCRSCGSFGVFLCSWVDVDILLRRDAVKPKSVGATLARFWDIFGKYWYVLLAVLALVWQVPGFKC